MPDRYGSTDEAAGTVVRVEPGSARVSEAIGVGNGPSSVAFGEGAVWVANRVDGTVSRIDPETEAVTSTVEVGAGPERDCRRRGRDLGGERR